MKPNTNHRKITVINNPMAVAGAVVFLCCTVAFALSPAVEMFEPIAAYAGAALTLVFAGFAVYHAWKDGVTVIDPKARVIRLPHREIPFTAVRNPRVGRTMMSYHNPEGGVEEFMTAGLEYAPGQIVLCDAGHSTRRLQKVVDALEQMIGTDQQEQLEKSRQVTHAAGETSQAPLIGGDPAQREAALECYLPAAEVEAGRPAAPQVGGRHRSGPSDE